jgi:BirA family transcriptional regulator, biotin operon repressor / biotin---[acetyl-CoA-carboxylase] ligase
MRVFSVSKMLGLCIPIFCASSYKFSHGDLAIAAKLNLDLVSLQQTIRTQRADVDVDWLETTTSTNQVLADDPTVGARYRVLGADSQTAGRGRRQRPWLSIPGQCLTFSMRLPSYQAFELQYLPSLPLLVGLVVIQAVQSWAVAHHKTLEGDLALKWPNDVLCNGKKVAGILIESKSAVVVGIGMNIFLSTQLTQSLPKKQGLSNFIEPGGLFSAMANSNNSNNFDKAELADLVAKIVIAILSADELHRTSGLGGNADRWNALHLFQGREVCLTDGDQLLHQGIVQGIGQHGELLLRNSLGRVQQVLSGDLSLRETSCLSVPQA